MAAQLAQQGDVQIEAPNGRTLVASIATLSAHSRVFNGLFSQGNYAGQRLPVQGVDSGALEAVIQSMYSGECQVSVTTAAAIYDAANKLEVSVLREKCLQFIQSTISSENCITFLTSAKQVRCGQLIDTFLECVVSRLTEVSASQSFLQLSYETAAELLLHAATKQQGVVVVRAAAAWLVHERSREVIHRAKLFEVIGVPASASQLVEQIMGEARAHAEDARDQVHKVLTAPPLMVKPEPLNHTPKPELAAAATLPAAPPLRISHLDCHLPMSMAGVAGLQGLPLVHVLTNGQLQAILPPDGRIFQNLQIPASAATGDSALASSHYLSCLLAAGQPSTAAQPVSSPQLIAPTQQLLSAQSQLTPMSLAAHMQPIAPVQLTNLGSPLPNSQQQQQLGGASPGLGTSPPPALDAGLGGDQAGAWRGLDGVLALAEAAEKEARREATVGGAAGKVDTSGSSVPLARATSFPTASPGDISGSGSSPRLLAAGVQAKRKGHAGPPHDNVLVPASLPFTKLGTAAGAAVVSTSKRRRPSHAVTPTPLVGFHQDRDAPGRLFDATPATSLSTSLLSLNPGAELKPAGSTLSAPPAVTAANPTDSPRPADAMGGVNHAQLLQQFLNQQAANMGLLPEAVNCASPEIESASSVGPPPSSCNPGNPGSLGSLMSVAASTAALGGINGGAVSPGVTPSTAAMAAMAVASLSSLQAAGVINNEADASREALMKTLMGLSVAGGPSLSLQAAMEPGVPPANTRMLQRLPRPPTVRGICHVDNCYADLTNLRDYHLRYKICDYHLKATSIMRDGIPQRFCQQCGRFHPLEAFDGTRRSCRAMLQRHNARRAKKAQETAGDRGG